MAAVVEPTKEAAEELDNDIEDDRRKRSLSPPQKELRNEAEERHLIKGFQLSRKKTNICGHCRKGWPHTLIISFRGLYLINR